MRLRYFCLSSPIPAISNLISMLPFDFISTISNVSNLFVFHLGTNFNMNNFDQMTN